MIFYSLHSNSNSQIFRINFDLNNRLKLWSQHTLTHTHIRSHSECCWFANLFSNADVYDNVGTNSIVFHTQDYASMLEEKQFDGWIIERARKGRADWNLLKISQQTMTHFLIYMYHLRNTTTSLYYTMNC